MKSLGLPYSIKNRENITTPLQSPFHDHHPPRDRGFSFHNDDDVAAVAPNGQRSPNPHVSSSSSLAVRAKDFFSGRRPAARVASNSSLHSSYSSKSARALAAARSQEHLPPPALPRQNSEAHPYAAMVASPVPVVSSHSAEDEKECPVCLEPLSFSFRLPGEKPHIVPDCGHALHEVCRPSSLLGCCVVVLF